MLPSASSRYSIHSIRNSNAVRWLGILIDYLGLSDSVCMAWLRNIRVRHSALDIRLASRISKNRTKGNTEYGS